MRRLKFLCVFAILVVMTVVLAGCGANVSTEMTISTAEGGFSGSRVMTLLIGNDDLDEVTGGLTALETVIKESKPADLTYTVSAPSETQSQITFTLQFTSLEDYKTKVDKLLKANADNEIVPEITYKKSDGVFKKNLQFEENFETVDLLMWYMNALVEADIISASTSDWYEKGSSTLIVDGATLNTSGYTFSYNNVDERYLSDCEVRTVLNANGTYDRTITLYAQESALEKLNEANADFAGYMKGIATDGITYATETDENSGKTTYTYTVSGVSAEELVTKTNAILQTTDNVFSVTIVPKEGAAGKAEITIQEKLNASYYLGEKYYSLNSTIVTFPNFRLTEGSANNNYQEGELSYRAAAGVDPYTLKGDWLVSYEKVELKLKDSSEKNLSFALVFQTNDALSAEIREIALSSLEAASKDNATFSKDGNVATCEFSGTPVEVTEKLNNFVRAYKTSEEQDDTAACGAMIEEMATASKFTNGLYGTLEIDLRDVVGDANIYISSEGDAQIATLLKNDDVGAYSGSEISVGFYMVELNLVTLILIIFFAVLLLAGVVLVIINRAGFAMILAGMKGKKATAQEITNAYSQDCVLPQQYVPEQEAPQACAPVQSQSEEVEEEVL